MESGGNNSKLKAHGLQLILHRKLIYRVTAVAATYTKTNVKTPPPHRQQQRQQQYHRWTNYNNIQYNV